MNIQPIVSIYQEPIINISQDIINLPSITDKDDDYIELIRNYPLPNDLQLYTVSESKEEVEDLIKLIGSFCQENSLEKVKNVIDIIQKKLQNKSPNLVKSWVRLIKGLHPKIDEYISKNKGYFSTPYSEVIGTNTILYYADTSSIDIWYWADKPKFNSNKVEWFLESWPSPTYLRESIREKLPSEMVDFIMTAGNITTTYMKRNVIFDALLTTEDETGTIVSQERPIAKDIAHGSSLNNDTYHQDERIFNGIKSDSKDDIINKLKNDGYLIHLLVNHITPLIPYTQSKNSLSIYKKPLGIEESFPNIDESLTIKVNSNNQVVLNNETKVNDGSLKPENN